MASLHTTTPATAARQGGRRISDRFGGLIEIENRQVEHFTQGAPPPARGAERAAVDAGLDDSVPW